MWRPPSRVWACMCGHARQMGVMYPPVCRHHRAHHHEKGLLLRQLDASPDDHQELSYCDVGGDQILSLVDAHDVRSGHLLDNHLIGHTEREVKSHHFPKRATHTSKHESTSTTTHRDALRVLCADSGRLQAPILWKTERVNHSGCLR